MRGGSRIPERDGCIKSRIRQKVDFEKSDSPKSWIRKPAPKAKAKPEAPSPIPTFPKEGSHQKGESHRSNENRTKRANPTFPEGKSPQNGDSDFSQRKIAPKGRIRLFPKEYLPKRANPTFSKGQSPQKGESDFFQRKIAPKGRIRLFDGESDFLA